jgi:hypothetical protein
LSLQSSKPYLSTEELGRELGFSPRTITLWVNAWHQSGGKVGIPGFKIGRSWRFDRTAIKAFIDSKRLPMQ